jgi:preprotein translocase subunit SecG
MLTIPTRPGQRPGQRLARLEDCMYVFLMVVHLLVCMSLIGVVLLQSGKGGGLAGGAFGGSAQTVFGGRGATDFITRATMVLGGAFFITSLTLALMSAGVARPTRSIIQEEARKSATAPGALPPATAPTQPSGVPATGAPAVGAPAGTPPAAPSTVAPAPGGTAPQSGSPGGATPAKPPPGRKPPGGM